MKSSRELPSRLRGWLNNLPIQDPVERSMASLLQVALIGLLLIIVLGTIMYVTIANLSIHEKLNVLLNDLVGFLVAGLPLVLIRRGYFRGSTLVIIVILFITPALAVIVVFDLLNSEGILFQFSLAIILAGLLVSRRALILTFALSAAVVGFGAYRGQNAAPQLATANVAMAINFILYNAVIALFIDRFGITLRTALTDALERGLELQKFIAERKWVEKELKISEEKYRALLETSPDIILTHDLTGRITYINQSGLKITEYSEADLTGSAIAAILPPEELAEMERRASARRRGEAGTYEYETKFISKSGRHVPIEVRSAPIIKEGQDAEFLINARDITERKRTEEALIESEQKFRNLVEQSSEGFTLVDEQGIIIEWNSAREKMTGLPRERVLDKAFWDVQMDMLVPEEQTPERYELNKQAITDALQTGKSYLFKKTINTEVITHNGNRKFFEQVIFPITTSLGYRIGSITRDVTERKRAETEREQYFIFFQTSVDIMCIADLNGAFMQVNPACSKTLGYSEAELISKPFIEFVHPDDKQSTLDEMARQLQMGFSLNFENRYICKDGSFRWLSWRANYNKDKGITYATARDVSEKKQADEALRSASLYARSLIEASLDPLATISPDGKITDVNQATETVTGVPRKQLIGNDFSNYFTEPGKAREGYQKVLAEGLVRDYPLTIRHTSGKTTDVLYNATVYKNEVGEIQGVFAAAHDTTERKQAEDEIHRLNTELEGRVVQRTAQLEAANKELEAFSYSVSHDLRAPLRAVTGYTNILLEDYEPALDAEGKRICNVISNEAQRMGQLIDDLLAFSRLNRTEMSNTTIAMQALTQTIFNELTTPESRERIDLQLGNLPSAIGDPALIRQVWVNLLANALKFTSKKERAVIEVGSAQSKEETVYFVRDNGAGFDARYVNKLFGVFQRLHGESEFEGTGVGLAIVQRVILRHGGRVWGEGLVDKGAVFYFALPRKEEPYE